LKAQPLRPLLEALLADPDFSNLTGEVQRANDLLKSDAMARLDARHIGVFALFVFNEKVDHVVAQYLASGSLASDVGVHVFVLYESAPKPRRVPSMNMDGLVRVQAENPLVAFARVLFPNQHLTLPGILVVERLSQSGEAVFISLDGDATSFNARIRRILSTVDQESAQRASDRSFAYSLGIKLSAQGVSYLRSGGISYQEQLVGILRTLWESKRDLLAIIPVVGKAFDKKDRA
jgi:hypothetical protein